MLPLSFSGCSAKDAVEIYLLLLLSKVGVQQLLSTLSMRNQSCFPVDIFAWYIIPIFQTCFVCQMPLTSRASGFLSINNPATFEQLARTESDLVKTTEDR